jgi:hypothetical protein
MEYAIPKPTASCPLKFGKGILLTWILAAGFWIIGGFHCIPARNFVFNEIATMLPRAILGKEW